MVAASAFIDDRIRDECITLGFDFIVDTPISKEYANKIFHEIDARNLIYTK